jgi:DNA-binding NtrC family response regulator
VSALGRILLLEDDEDVVAAIELAVAAQNGSVLAIRAPEALAQAMTAGPFDVALIDMNFSPGHHDGNAGLAALDALRSADEALSVVAMTVYGGVALAVEALKRGASDFVLKPWHNRRLLGALAAGTDLTRARRGAANFNLEALERQTIERALMRHAGNISQAAAALGITRPALYRRMEKHGL